jgi:putative FmdB family regulatory protein
MPTYEYVCEKCGHRFEQIQSITEKPLKTCPKKACPRKTWGKGRVQRAITGGGGLLFKGSGFYITDYRSEGYKAAAKKEASTSTGGDAKPAPAKTETATPAKSESKTAKPTTPPPK